MSYSILIHKDGKLSARGICMPSDDNTALMALPMHVDFESGATMHSLLQVFSSYPVFNSIFPKEAGIPPVSSFSDELRQMLDALVLQRSVVAIDGNEDIRVQVWKGSSEGHRSISATKTGNKEPSFMQEVTVAGIDKQGSLIDLDMYPLSMVIDLPIKSPIAKTVTRHKDDTRVIISKTEVTLFEALSTISTAAPIGI